VSNFVKIYHILTILCKLTCRGLRILEHGVLVDRPTDRQTDTNTQREKASINKLCSYVKV